MQPYRLRHVPRLARVLIGRILDYRAAVESRRKRLLFKRGALLIDQIDWQRRSIQMRGHNAAGPLSVGIQDGAPHALAEGQFNVTLPRNRDGKAVLTIASTHDQNHPVQIAGPRPWRETLARWLKLPIAILDILAESPAIVSLMRSGNPLISVELQQRLGLTKDATVPLLPATLFGPTKLAAPPHDPVIILPVFNGFDVLDTLLDRLFESCGTSHHLVIVDDHSNDPRVHPRLESYAAAHADTTTLIRHTRNLGFVHSANAGIEAARRLTKGHFVLLNSDTQPPDGWLLRLLRPILDDPGIASVTPMSNAAEIFSVPAPVGSDPLGIEEIAQIDQIAATLDGRCAMADGPTGIGFCMALNRAFVEQIGGFDPIFGRGYGEEVDWCQKARRVGGRHVCIGDLFVGHHGAVSFGASARSANRQKGDALIRYRYPGFDADVRDWCHDDPLGAARFVLSLAWLAQVSDDAVPLFLGHGLGGGAEAALRVEIAAAFAAGSRGVVILRVGGPRMWRIEMICPEVHHVFDVHDKAQLMQLLSAFPSKKIVYSCGVGSRNPIEVPRLLLDLANEAVSLDLRFHDFLAISPSWTLLENDGQYRGVPDTNTTDRAHVVPEVANHLAWRELWAKVMNRAREATVFSQSSETIVRKAFPDAGKRIALRPHRLIHVPPPLAPGGQNIGILGSINQAKGAVVLQHLSPHLVNRRLVVIGEMDGRMMLRDPHIVHGRFEGSEFSKLAQRYDVGLWLIPSVWPETFSFATHEALATGLPVLTFNLGAQAEAARAAENGHVLKSRPEDACGLAAEIEDLFQAQSEEKVRAAS